MNKNIDNQLVKATSYFIFFLLPWYYMHSGLPQPVDVFISLTLIVFALMKFPHLVELYRAKMFRCLCYFIVYTIIILLVNLIANNSIITATLIVQNVYYFTMLIVFPLIFLRLKNVYGETQCFEIILWLILTSCLLPLGDWLLSATKATRISLTFNNPNQLGFFSLVNISIVYYIGLLSRDHGFKINKWLAIFIININILFLFLSASRSCYPVIALYIFCYLFFFDINFKSRKLFLYKLMLGLGALIAFTLLIYKMYQHMIHIRQGQSPIDVPNILGDFYFRALRGMDFELMNLWDLLFGNGTYTTSIRGSLEFHNNFIAIFNQIGLLGLIFYFYVNGLAIVQLCKKGYLYLFPFFCYLFYSMFQYSYRTRVHWLFIAVIIFLTIHVHMKTNDYFLKTDKGHL